jgi:hypothetical protein
VDLTDRRRLAAQAVLTAPTLLETFFWGWLCGASSAELYLEELMITDLWGDGGVPDDFRGTP